MKEASGIIRIDQGTVNRAREHFRLYYQPAEKRFQNSELVALLGPPQDGVVLLEYLVGDGGPHSTAIRDAVHRQVTFYLTSKQEAKPWEYARYHCGTLANLYSEVRWSFIDPSQHAPCERS